MRPNMIVQYYRTFNDSWSWTATSAGKGQYSCTFRPLEAREHISGQVVKIYIRRSRDTKFWISSFQRHAASGGFYNQSDDEKCNWLAWKMWRPAFWKKFTYNSFQWLPFIPIIKFWTLTGSCAHAFFANGSPEKPVWPIYGHAGTVAPTPPILFCGKHVVHYIISAPTWGVWVWVFPLGHEYYEHQYSKLYY